jgi:PAS domain S-box-containing protein
MQLPKNQRVQKSESAIETSVFFELSNDLMCAIAFNGYIQQTNPAFRANLGDRNEQLVGKSFLGFVHREDFAATVAIIEQLKQNNQTITFKNRYRCQDGSYQWLAWTARSQLETYSIYAVARPMEQNKPIDETKYIVCSAELASASTAQRESEEQFRALVENIHENVFWISDLREKRLIYVSSAYEKIWQRPCEELYDDYKAWLKAIHPQDRERVENAFSERALMGSYDEEYRLVCLDGSIRWIRDRAFPIQDSLSGRDPAVKRQGFLPLRQSYRIVGIAEDITARKRTEQSLRQNELNFRTLADTMPQLFWTTLADGFHDYFNQRWYEYTGMTLEQTQGWGWSHLLHPDDRQRTLEIWTECLRTGKEYNIEYRFRRASDEKYRWFIGRAFALRDENGQIIKWFGSCTDIEEQKQTMEERDRALDRERAARASAEAANRIKDEFLAVLSHELRTPLNPILGWASLLRTRQWDEQTMMRGLETIERNAKLQTQLIEDLLDVSRILRGKLSLTVASVDPTAIVEAALETVYLAAQAKSIQIQKYFQPNIALVWGDASRLQQILWNLLSNAVKFTSAGGGIEVHLQQVDREVTIIIKDNGKGIESDFLPYVFDYFRQADSSISRTVGGLGLGLAIVHHLVQLHGGSVTAESLGKEQGAIFTVKFPIPPSQNELKKEEKIDDSFLLASQVAPLNGVAILLVDDEVDTRETQTMILQQYGASVIAVASAAEALQALQQAKPDLLISDLGMPKVNGYSLIAQVRMLSPEQGGQILAIALSAYAADSDRQLALKAGYQLHIAKPVEPAKLVTSIVRLLAKN